MNLFLDERATSLFVGKTSSTKNLNEIEKIFINCENENTGLMDLGKLEKQKSKIEEFFKKEFNFKDISLSFNVADTYALANFIMKNGRITEEDIIPNLLGLNSYTFAIEDLYKTIRTLATKGTLDPKVLIVRSSNGGYKFSSPNDAPFVSINIGPFLAARLSARELLAVILHEIGHNFYQTNLIGTVYSYIGVPILAFKKLGFKLKDYVIENLKAHGINLATKYISKYFNKFMDFITPDFVNENKSIFYAISSSLLQTAINVSISLKLALERGLEHFINLISKNPERIFINPEQAIDIFTVALSGRYNNEVFADNFAAIYGYGADLANGLAKISSTGMNIFDKSSTKSEIQTADTITGIITLPLTFLSGIMSTLDEHPGLYSRADNVRTFLKEQYAREKDPKTRKQISQSLKQLEEVISKRAFSFYSNAIFNIPVDGVKSILSKIFLHNDSESLLKNVQVVNNSAPVFLKESIYPFIEEDFNPKKFRNFIK